MPIIPAAELPIDQYHSCAPEWLSKTSIKDFIKHGPAWWQKAYVLKSIERPIPEGVEQGSALDCYLTEGVDAFNGRYVVKPPGMNFSTTAGKAWKAEHAGSEIITSDDYVILMDCIDAVRKHPIWPEIEKCQAQLTVRRKSEGLGIGLQSRPDWLNLGCGDLFDLKKCRSLDVFASQTVNLGYITQAALAGWCLAGDGVALNRAYLVAVEWEIGARCRVKELDQEDLQLADQAMRLHAADIADRIQRNDWDDHPPRSEMLALNKWQKQALLGEEA